MSHCLKTSCNEMISVLKATKSLSCSDVEHTVIFLDKLLKFWKIIRFKKVCKNKRKYDSLKKVVLNVDDPHLDGLKYFVNLAKWMRGNQSKTIKFLTQNTSYAIEHTFQGIAEACQYLSNNDFQYVS